MLNDVLLLHLLKYRNNSASPSAPLALLPSSKQGTGVSVRMSVCADDKPEQALTGLCPVARSFPDFSLHLY